MYQIGPLIGCECNFRRKMRGLKNLGEKVAFFFDQADSNLVKYVQEVNWDQNDIAKFVLTATTFF